MMGMWLWRAHSQVDRASSAPSLGAPLTPKTLPDPGTPGGGHDLPPSHLPKGGQAIALGLVRPVVYQPVVCPVEQRA